MVYEAYDVKSEGNGGPICGQRRLPEEGTLSWDVKDEWEFSLVKVGREEWFRPKEQHVLRQEAGWGIPGHLYSQGLGSGS